MIVIATLRMKKAIDHQKIPPAIILSQNLAGRRIPTNASEGPTVVTTQGQKLPQMMPVKESTEPVTAAAQAPAVVPFFQYNPPMIAAPAPPVKMAAVSIHQRVMYCVC